MKCHIENISCSQHWKVRRRVTQYWNSKTNTPPPLAPNKKEKATCPNTFEQKTHSETLHHECTVALSRSTPRGPLSVELGGKAYPCAVILFFVFLSFLLLPEYNVCKYVLNEYQIRLYLVERPLHTISLLFVNTGAHGKGGTKYRSYHL